MTNLERMIKLAEEFFATRNDPSQISVTPEIMDRLRRIHPATLSEYDDGNGPVAWVLLIPTTTDLMNRFIKNEIEEQQLLDITPLHGSYDAIYLCSALVIPEHRGKGLAKQLTCKAIKAIQQDHSIKSLFYWSFSHEGEKLATTIANKLNIPLIKQSTELIERFEMELSTIGNQKVEIAYGKGSIDLMLDPSLANWHIIKPKHQEVIPNLEETFQNACNNPIGYQPLSEIIKPTDRIVIVTSDGTRPVPHYTILTNLIKILNVPVANITVLLGNGTHRKNTPKDIEEMFGDEFANSLRIINHDAYDVRQNQLVGKSPSKGSVYLNKLYLQADKRIVLGFIEPHFFAGFSGGAKGIIPAIGGIETIFHLHRPELIAHPKSTWSELDENPIHQEILEMAKLCPPHFLINVTLNSENQITGIYAGDYIQAHREGCKQVKEASMVPVNQKFPIVITSNSGYPLDQNLYQTVKGISSAARIVEKGGTIFVASECSDGIPYESNFAQLMRQGSTPADILYWILNQKKPQLDQWQGQILAGILKNADVGIFSSIPQDEMRAVKLKPIDNLQASVEEKIRSLGNGINIAVMPHGPLTTPFISGI